MCNCLWGGGGGGGGKFPQAVKKNEKKKRKKNKHMEIEEKELSETRAMIVLLSIRQALSVFTWHRRAPFPWIPSPVLCCPWRN